jgi:YcaO-like protein with predicted kinase domain
MLTRSLLKRRSAEALNRLSQDTLFDRFQVTRVGEITGLDSVGVPVWAATRPCAKVISVTAGKSLDSQMARAGAIAESIEYSTFENPTGEFVTQDWTMFDPKNLQVAKEANWQTAHEIPVEHITHLATGKHILYPSDLVWLGDRGRKTELFQRTSNGQAVAGSFDEAFLAGLYECIERDAITIRTCAMQEFGRIPPKHDLAILEGKLASLRSSIAEAGLTLFLFHCTFDIPLPVYWAIVIDKSGELAPFAGWGCNLDSRIAAERAILEALQSRLVYISGARDDIMRRNFDLLRNQDPTKLIDLYSSLPASDTFQSKIGDLIPAMEKNLVLGRMSHWVKHVLFKHIEVPFGLHAVKVFVIGLEGPVTPAWQPSRWLTVRKYYEDQHDLLLRANSIRGGSEQVAGGTVAPASSAG